MRHTNLLFAISFLLIAGCNKTSSSEPSVQEEYFSNKSKWESNKEKISRYKIVEYQSTMGSWLEITVIFNSSDSTPEFCEEKVGRWDGDAPTVTDCKDNELYHRSVEYYFNRFEELITEDTITEAIFDEEYGVPTRILGTSPGPQCADCVAAGFDIEFTVLE